MKRLTLPTADEALAGSDQPITPEAGHAIKQTTILPPFPDGCETVLFGMGCFWGAEKAFWQLDGVYTTAVGYAAGITPNPRYEEVCSGLTGHNEVVLVVYDPTQLSFTQLLKTFWEGHDPTQGMRQGNDIGTQYRSGIYYTTEQQRHQAEQSLLNYQDQLSQHARGEITTEILAKPSFYYAESYHQQYLAKNPGGYCGLGGTGIPCFLEK